MRGNRFGTIADYLNLSNQNVTVAVQIESPLVSTTSKPSVRCIGVDCVFIGPSDLAAGLGHLGAPNHEHVQAAIERVFAAAWAHGVAVGILAPAELPAPASLPASAALTQLRSVWSLKPSSFAVAGIDSPAFTRFTASSLNSVVYALPDIFISCPSKVTSILRYLWKTKFQGKLISRRKKS
jgi:hypothetical protein